MSWLGRILYADSDEHFRDFVAASLRRFGLLAVGVDTAAQLMSALGREPAGLVIIDEHLPDASGTTLCAHVRSRVATPIVFTSHTDSVDLRVRALQLGADDAVLKPFDPRELAARIEAVMRRGQAGAAQQRVLLGAWTLDIAARRLVGSDGRQRSLTAVEYRLLSVLLRRPNQPMSRDELSVAMRGLPLGPLDRYVDNLVSKLRRKLDDPVDAPQLIKTFRGEGYVLSLPQP